MSSSVASGSNAPVIVDDLVAWPPPPSIARFGGSGVLRQTRLSLINPLSSPPSAPSNASTTSLNVPSSSFPGASPLTGYASARPLPQPPQTPKSPTRLGTSWTDDEPSLLSPTKASSRRAYAPPKQPLSPQHLGRIAQSFGIVTPTLPPDSSRASASSSSSSTRSSTRAYSRPPTQQSHHTHNGRHTPAPSLSQQVVAVVPPTSLLPQEPESDPVAAKDRVRKWRRGRLLPLQPTLSAMLVVIAREFGLPSTTGLKVYLGSAGGYPEGAPADDVGGPLITQDAWAALVEHGAIGLGAGIGDSPRSQTGSIKRLPRASTSPLTRVDENAQQHGRDKSLSSLHDTRSSLSSASSFTSPRTPASVSLSSPPFGTIEFDVAPDAPWLADYRSGRGLRPRESIALLATKAAEADTTAGGIRNLRLVDRLNDQRPRFLRDMADERERARAKSRAAQEAALEAARVSAAQRESIVQEQRVRRESELERQRSRTLSDSVPSPRRPGSVRSPVARTTNLMSPAPTPPRPARSSARPPSTIESHSNHGHAAEPEPIMEEPAETMTDAADTATTGEDTETLTPLQSQLFSSVLDDNDRTSCVVMAHQLNHLEKMMKTLSPQDLRLTITPGSPRASVGGLEERMLGAASSGDNLSPGASGDGDSLRPTSSGSGEIGALPPRGSSRLPYLQPENRSSVTVSSDSASPLASPDRRPSDQRASQLSERASHLTIDRSDSVASNRRSTYGHASEGDRSSILTLNGQRVRSTGPPPRPARPPTPDLSEPDLVEHVLPPSYVDHIKTPLPNSRPASMSLKGLKRQLSMRPESGIGGLHHANGSVREFGAGANGSLGRANTRSTYINDAPRRRRESEFGGGGGSRLSRLFGRKPSIDDTRRMTIVHLSSPVGTAPPTQLHSRQESREQNGFGSFNDVAPGGPPVQLLPAGTSYANGASNGGASVAPTNGSGGSGGSAGQGGQGVGLSSAVTGLAGIPHARKPSRDVPAPLVLRRGTPSDGTMSPTSPRSNYTRRKPVPGSDAAGSARGSMDLLSE